MPSRGQFPFSRAQFVLSGLQLGSTGVDAIGVFRLRRSDIFIVFQHGLVHFGNVGVNRSNDNWIGFAHRRWRALLLYVGKRFVDRSRCVAQNVVIRNLNVTPFPALIISYLPFASSVLAVSGLACQ